MVTPACFNFHQGYSSSNYYWVLTTTGLLKYNKAKQKNKQNLQIVEISAELLI